MLPKPKRKQDRSLLDRISERPCCVCGKAAPSDPSHIKSRGAGGPDTKWNVVPMCRECHHIWHQMGWAEFCRRRPRFKLQLEFLGWEVNLEEVTLTHEWFVNSEP